MPALNDAPVPAPPSGGQAPARPPDDLPHGLLGVTSRPTEHHHHRHHHAHHCTTATEPTAAEPAPHAQQEYLYHDHQQYQQHEYHDVAHTPLPLYERLLTHQHHRKQAQQHLDRLSREQHEQRDQQQEQQPGDSSSSPPSQQQQQQQNGLGLIPGAHVSRLFLSGGLAGAVSRTCTAPMDRLKLLLQVHDHKRVMTLREGLARMASERTFKAYFRGNGANVLKNIPETALKLTANDAVKRLVAGGGNGGAPMNGNGGGGGVLSPADRVVIGGLAGAIAQGAVYPLEVIQTRLAVSPRGTYRGITDTATKVLRSEGPRAFYRGILPCMVGIWPYAGIDIAAFELIKERLVRHHLTAAAAQRRQQQQLQHRLDQQAAEGPGAGVVSSYSVGSARAGTQSAWHHPVATAAAACPPHAASLAAQAATPHRGGWPAAAPPPPLAECAANTGEDAYEVEQQNQAEAWEHEEACRSVPASAVVPTYQLLLTGMVSSSLGQLVAYPFSLARTRLQAQGVSGQERRYSGMMDVLAKAARYEGLRGLYKGVLPDLLKTAPAAGISWAVFEASKGWLDVAESAAVPARAPAPAPPPMPAPQLQVASPPLANGAGGGGGGGR